MFIQNAPIIWFIKTQNTVEAAKFGSKLVALRICKDFIVVLRYKLRMFGFILEGHAYAFCDNRGVVKNTNIPEVVHHMKHNAINYNSVREAVAADILLIGKEDGETILENFLAKFMTVHKRWD